jgi:hypothetical protein
MTDTTQPREQLAFDDLPALAAIGCRLHQTDLRALPANDHDLDMRDRGEITDALEAELSLWSRLFYPGWAQLDLEHRIALRVRVELVHGWLQPAFERAVADAEQRALGRQIDQMFDQSPRPS